MPVRPLALAALLLLVPAPVAAHAAETTPPPAPAAESPADVPPSAAPGVEEPAGGAGPADPPATAPDAGSGEMSAPDDGSTPLPDERPSPAPGGGSTPEPSDAQATATPGTTPDADTDAEELTGLVHTSVVGTTAPTAHQPGSGALLRPQSVVRAQLLPAQQQVVPGTLTRIAPGTVTRVPAQDPAADSSTTAWAVGLSAVGAAALAVVLGRRTRRSSAGG